MLEEMILNTGQIFRGRYAKYRLLNALQTPTVFKAQVLESLTITSELYDKLRISLQYVMC